MKSISALSNCIKKKIKQQPQFWVILAALVLFLLLILIISVSSQKPSTSTYRAEKVIINLPEVNIKTSQGNLDFWRDEVVQAGDTIEMVLGRFGISETEINRITSIETIKKQVQHLQVNQVFSIRTDNNGKLTDIQFFNDDGNGEKNLVVLKKIDDHWRL